MGHARLGPLVARVGHEEGAMAMSKAIGLGRAVFSMEGLPGRKPRTE
jgi:hypothetical protein